MMEESLKQMWTIEEQELFNYFPFLFSIFTILSILSIFLSIFLK